MYYTLSKTHLIYPTWQEMQLLRAGWAIVMRKQKQRQMHVRVSTPTYQLYAVEQGVLEIKCNDAWCDAGPRSVTLLRRCVPQFIRPKVRAHSAAITIAFSFLGPTWLADVVERPIVLPGPWWRRLLNLEAKCQFDGAGMRIVEAKQLLEFILDLTRTKRLATVNPQHLPVRPGTESSWVESWILAEDIIRERGSTDLTVMELAKLVGVSKSKLFRIFQSAKGISPQTALKNWRIEQAKNLLKKWVSVKQVAAMVGYASPQYFARAFKRCTGQTPSEYCGAD